MTACRLGWRPRARVALVALGIYGGVCAGVFATPVRLDAQQCPSTPGDAFAFLPVNPPADSCPATPVVHWPQPSVVFECGYFADAEHGVTCGENPTGCVERCRGVAAVWNADLLGHFTFVQADAATPAAFCTSGGDNSENFDGRTSIGGSAVLCDGSAFGPSVLAVTLRRTIVSGPRRGELVDSDITLNNGFNFSGGLFDAVIGHELGHVLGLDHPDQCGRDFNVLMRSILRSPADPCFVQEPVADDVAGATMIYPLSAPSCGDADSSGSITVTDGVQTLRGAAGLSSMCTPTVCDVDGDGSITVTDGVNVLRAAAGLPATLTCGG